MVARDPKGVKPLYYADCDNYLIISSEIRGILASGLIPKNLNKKEISSYLRFKYALKPSTLFEGVYEFEESALYDFDHKAFLRLPSTVSYLSCQSKIPFLC